MTDLLRPAAGEGTVLEVTPRSAGWRDLGFALARLPAGATQRVETGDREVAFVPQHGPVAAHVNGVRYDLSRSGPFDALPHVLYAPPGTTVELRAEGDDAEIAWGSAPAEGRYPLRLFAPEEMRREVRGGGPAVREVHHVLAHPLPAERLIVFEVYVPGGAWSGWPPHCHDGRLGSGYLEETYYYRIRPESGWAVHRNYTREGDMDDVHVVRDETLVQVRGGFHPVAAAPGSNVYFLNFLAGDLRDEGRGRPPVDDPDHAWIVDRWEEARMALPLRFEGDD